MGCPGRELCLNQSRVFPLSSLRDKVYIGGTDPDQKFIDIRMNAIKRKILILSGKGGKIRVHTARTIYMLQFEIIILKNLQELNLVYISNNNFIITNDIPLPVFSIF